MLLVYLANTSPQLAQVRERDFIICIIITFQGWGSLESAAKAKGKQLF